MKILIVDDEPDFLKLVSAILVNNEYEYLCATSIKEAIRQLHSNSTIGLIFCDIRMQGQDGFELLKFIKQNLRFCHIPIIMISALKDEASVKKSISMGSAAYLVKPIQEDTLLAKIQHVLDTNVSTILIVDEDQLVRKILEDTMRREKYRAIGVSSGAEALEMLSSNTIDLVISNIFLSKMSGLNLLVEIKEKYNNMPVVLIADRGTKFSKERVIESGADGFLSRPFSNLQATAEIRGLLPKLGARR